jgi:ATP-dependent protease ClpP protease subunit
MAKIRINGVIIPNDYKWIYDLFEIDSTSPSDITKVIDSLTTPEDLEIEINSPGGDVYSGSEIYTAIKGYKGNVEAKIVGIAASAASIIAMAANKIMISPTAQIMIHNVSEGPLYGDNRVFEHEAEVLKNYNISIANAYQLKTGLPQDKILELMNAGGSANQGTWLNAQQAKELGFADEIMFDEGNRLAASFNSGAMFTPEIINKLRNLLQPLIKDGKLGSKPLSGEDKGLLQARLNFLKLKGGAIQ